MRDRLYTDLLQLPTRLGMGDLAAAARASGVICALQIVVHQGNRRLRHSVARVVESQLGEVDLLVAYEGVDLSPRRVSHTRERIAPLHRALDMARFDRLQDQPGITIADAPLWLVQRATGTHLHGVILAPDKPALPWSRIVNAVHDCLPAAVREAPLR